MIKKWFTKQMLKLLKDNGKAQLEAQKRDESIDFQPVVKLFTPDANATWLLTEISPENEDEAFGLCDLGLGSPELGYLSLLELQSVRGRYGLPVERDLHFKADKPISEYTRIAREKGQIVD